MSTQPLTQYENALLHQIAKLTEALDRNTLAQACVGKPMLTDAEAAHLLGFKGRDSGQFMNRQVKMGLFYPIRGGHFRLWSKAQLEQAFVEAHAEKRDITPSAQTPKSDRKSRESAA